MRPSPKPVAWRTTLRDRWTRLAPTPASAAGRTKAAGSLQALRAVAAGLVVLYHVSHSIFGTDKYWPARPFGRLFEFGHSGVEFFFVLSGFIIYAAHKRDVGQPGKLAEFAWKRFRRVYPVYWVVLLAVIPVYFIMPSMGNGAAANPGTVVDSFSLIHLLGDGEVLTVSWTLFHEVTFYAMFSLLIVDRTIGRIVISAWLAGSLLPLVVPSMVGQKLGFYLSPLHLLFGMGMVTAWITDRICLKLPWLVTLAGIGVFLATGAEDNWGGRFPEVALALLYGLGSSMTVAGALELERGGRLKVPGAFVFLGNASFSIYLVHFVALSLLAKAVMWTSGYWAIPHGLTFILLAVASIGLGIAYHLVVEVPLLAVLGRVKPVQVRRTGGYRGRASE